MNSQISEGWPVLPDWMQTSPLHEVSPGRKGRRPGFLNKTVHGIQNILAEDLLSEQYASRPGLLQRIDPRIKVLGTLMLLIAAGFTRSLAALIILAVFPAILMRASLLPVGKLELRFWGIIPVITLLLALPGTLSVFNPGIPLLFITHDPQGITFLKLHMHGPIYISRQGVMAALFLFSRVGVSISLGGLLVLTTPVSLLLKSITVLGVPAFFVMIVEMSYRYIILLLTISLEMYEARKMRTVGYMSAHTQRDLLGSSIAALFGRSMALADEVYQSMTARCYTGQAVSSEPMVFHRLDFVSITIIIILAVAVAFGGAVFG